MSLPESLSTEYLSDRDYFFSCSALLVFPPRGNATRSRYGRVQGSDFPEKSFLYTIFANQNLFPFLQINEEKKLSPCVTDLPVPSLMDGGVQERAQGYVAQAQQST